MAQGTHQAEVGPRWTGYISTDPPNPPQHKEVIAENTVLRLGMVPTMTHAYQLGRSLTSEHCPQSCHCLPWVSLTACWGSFCHLNFLCPLGNPYVPLCPRPC